MHSAAPPEYVDVLVIGEDVRTLKLFTTDPSCSVNSDTWCVGIVRAKDTADGCWLTRGHFSQNCTFIVKNYLRNSILWYGHLCMRGNDDVVDEPLFPGTAKSAKGHLAEVLFKRAKAEGCNIEINWQDNDSSAAKSVSLSFPSAQIMFCAGHVGRVHTHRLTDLKAKKSFTPTDIALH